MVVVGFWQGVFPASQAEALEILEAAVEQAKTQGATLLVFPELFLGGYLLVDAQRRALSDEAKERLRAIAQRGVALVFGYFEAAEGRLYNAVMAIDANGVVAANYRKTHLFGVAEKAAFAAGDALCEPFDIAGLRIALLICYDLEFPEVARAAALKGARLLVVPTANMEPYDSVNDLVVRVRALENHVYVCYCNWSDYVSAEDVHFNGRSSVCGPNGDILAGFGAADRGVKFVDIPPANADQAEDDYLRDRRADLYGILLETTR